MSASFTRKQLVHRNPIHKRARTSRLFRVGSELSYFCLLSLVPLGDLLIEPFCIQFVFRQSMNVRGTVHILEGAEH